MRWNGSVPPQVHEVRGVPWRYRDAPTCSLRTLDAPRATRARPARLLAPPPAPPSK
jgi:hypothetical protein